MMLGVRDLRLAQTAEDVQKAAAMVQARTESVSKYAGEALKLIHLPENRERVEKVKAIRHDIEVHAPAVPVRLLK